MWACRFAALIHIDKTIDRVVVCSAVFTTSVDRTSLRGVDRRQEVGRALQCGPQRRCSLPWSFCEEHQVATAENGSLGKATTGQTIHIKPALFLVAWRLPQHRCSNCWSNRGQLFGLHMLRRGGQHRNGAQLNRSGRNLSSFCQALGISHAAAVMSWRDLAQRFPHLPQDQGRLLPDFPWATETTCVSSFSAS